MWKGEIEERQNLNFAPNLVLNTPWNPRFVIENYTTTHLQLGPLPNTSIKQTHNVV
jgi:hypothetical protein